MLNGLYDIQVRMSWSIGVGRIIIVEIIEHLKYNKKFLRMISLVITLWDRQLFYPHFTHEESETQEVRKLVQVYITESGMNGLRLSSGTWYLSSSDS